MPRKRKLIARLKDFVTIADGRECPGCFEFHLRNRMCPTEGCSMKQGWQPPGKAKPGPRHIAVAVWIYGSSEQRIWHMSRNLYDETVRFMQESGEEFAERDITIRKGKPKEDTDTTARLTFQPND